MGSDVSDQDSHSSSYIPADRDTELLQRDELRSVRLGLELLKPELIQTDEGIGSHDRGLRERSAQRARCRTTRNFNARKRTQHVLLVIQHVSDRS